MAARCLLYFADLALAVPLGEKGKGFEIHWFMLPDCKSGRTERAENPAEREGGLVQGCSKVSYRAVRGSSRELYEGLVGRGDLRRLNGGLMQDCMRRANGKWNR